MKGITNFINETISMNSLQFVNELKAVLSNKLITNLKPYNGEDDINRFSAQDDNAKTICDEINKRGKYHAVTICEYYKLWKKSDMRSLSKQEYAKIDAKFGDIIFIDENNMPLCKFDLKVGTKHTGSISLGSIMQFDANGFYICCCINKGTYKIIAHNTVDRFAKLPNILRRPSDKHKYKGNPVEFNGHQLTSEWWISSDNLRSI